MQTINYLSLKAIVYLASLVHINRLAVSANTCKATSEHQLLKETAALGLCAAFQVWSATPVLKVPLGRVTKSDALLIANKQSGWLAEQDSQASCHQWPSCWHWWAVAFGPCQKRRCHLRTPETQIPTSTSNLNHTKSWMQKKNITKHPSLKCKFKRSFEIRVFKECNRISQLERETEVAGVLFI